MSDLSIQKMGASSDSNLSADLDLPENSTLSEGRVGYLNCSLSGAVRVIKWVVGSTTIVLLGTAEYAYRKSPSDIVKRCSDPALPCTTSPTENEAATAFMASGICLFAIATVLQDVLQRWIHDRTVTSPQRDDLEDARLALSSNIHRLLQGNTAQEPLSPAVSSNALEGVTMRGGRSISNRCVQISYVACMTPFIFMGIVGLIFQESLRDARNEDIANDCTNNPEGCPAPNDDFATMIYMVSNVVLLFSWYYMVSGIVNRHMVARQDKDFRKELAFLVDADKRLEQALATNNQKASVIESAEEKADIGSHVESHSELDAESDYLSPPTMKSASSASVSASSVISLGDISVTDSSSEELSS